MAVGPTMRRIFRIVYDSTAGALKTKIVTAAGTDAIGEVQTTPTANTVLARLKNIQTGTVLAAGTNAIGKLAANDGVDIGDVDVTSIAAGTNRIGTVSGVLKEVRVTKALEAAVAYTANDVLSETDTDTEGTDWDFDAVGRANGAYGYIVGAIAISESESVTPRLTLFLFNTAPTGCELDDNAANTAPDAADLAKVIGRIDFPALESLGTTDSMAVATPSTVGNLPLPFKCAAADDAIYGVLVTRDAFTQSAGDDLTIILLVEQY